MTVDSNALDVSPTNMGNACLNLGKRGSKLELLEITKEEESLPRHEIRNTIHHSLWDSIGLRKWHPTNNQEPKQGDD